MTTPKYYIYVYAHPLTGNIFYIGKGSGKRSESHLKSVLKNKVPNAHNHELRKNIKDILGKGLLPMISKIKYFDNENEAYESERNLIALLRETHKLTNIMDGGEGISSERAKQIHRDKPELRQIFFSKAREYSQSKENRERVSKQMKERWSNDIQKKKISKKISKALTNNAKAIFATKQRWQDPEYRDKMCAMMKAKWQDPSYQNKMKVRDEKLKKNGEYRLKMSETMKKVWAERKAI